MLGQSSQTWSRAQPWSQGDAGKYFGGTYNSWVPCRVQAVDQQSGAVMLDIKPGHWLSKEEQQRLLVRVSQAEWSVGQRAKYFSQRQGVYIDCQIIDADS